jgi:hypothetical protein
MTVLLSRRNSTRQRNFLAEQSFLKDSSANLNQLNFFWEFSKLNEKSEIKIDIESIVLYFFL